MWHRREAIARGLAGLALFLVVGGGAAQPTGWRRSDAASPGGKLVPELRGLLSHISLSHDGARLAPDLRLSRQALVVRAPLARSGRRAWRALLNAGFGVARLHTRVPADAVGLARSSHTATFVEAALTVEYRPAPGWRMFAGVRELAGVGRTSGLVSAGRRAPLRVLDVAPWPRVTLGVQVELP